MDLGKLIPLGESKQILEAIDKGSAFGGDLWQVGDLGRTTFPIIQIQSDLNYKKIVIRSFNLININPFGPLFIRLCYRNLIFRVDPGNYQILGDKIAFQYPQSARALAKRRTERYVMPFDAQISLSLRRSMKTLKDLGRELEVRILDVSEKGFGLLISGSNRDFLVTQDKIWIKAIDQRPLSKYLFGRVTYVSGNGYYLKKGDTRIGIHLETPLHYVLFEALKRKSHLILGA